MSARSLECCCQNYETIWTGMWTPTFWSNTIPSMLSKTYICLQPSMLHSAITQRAVIWMLLWTTSNDRGDLHWQKITNLWFPGTPNVSSFFNWSSYRWSVFGAWPYAPSQSYLGTGAAPSVLNQPGLSRPCRSWKIQPALTSSWNIKHNLPVTCTQ